MIAKTKGRGFSCSFCGRSQGEVASIVAGIPQRVAGVPKQVKSAFICNECVERYRSHAPSSSSTANSVINK